jgi:hypothetical protein
MLHHRPKLLLILVNLTWVDVGRIDEYQAEEYQAEKDAQQWYDPLSWAATTAKSRAADGWERHHYKPEAAYK